MTNTAVNSRPRVQLVDLRADEVAQPRVEVAQRLVEQHQPRPGDQASRERDALLLTAAELGRIAVEQRLAVDQPSRLLDPALADLVLHAARLERVRDVLAHRHVRPQRV